MNEKDSKNIENILHYAERGLCTPNDVLWLCTKLQAAYSTIDFLEMELSSDGDDWAADESTFFK